MPAHCIYSFGNLFLWHTIAASVLAAYTYRTWPPPWQTDAGRGFSCHFAAVTLLTRSVRCCVPPLEEPSTGGIIEHEGPPLYFQGFSQESPIQLWMNVPGPPCLARDLGGGDACNLEVTKAEPSLRQVVQSATQHLPLNVTTYPYSATPTAYAV